jgi:hypothetical protein
MIVSTHQPVFLPWPGLFLKAMKSDCTVLLDAVQFPRGRGWMTRNRLKNERGELWLRVPVHRKGRGLTPINEVEIVHAGEWPTRHLKSIRQSYKNAPYFDEFFPAIEALYRENHDLLSELNIGLIKLLWDALSLGSNLVLQSELGVRGRGTELLVDLCSRLGASEWLGFRAQQDHLDQTVFETSGITARYIGYDPPVYPQLWGDFIYNLSTLDMLLNCGPKCSEITAGGMKE